MSALEPLQNQAERLDWLPDGMNWRSTWNVNTQYVKNDVVRSALSLNCYVANGNSRGGLDPANTPAPSIWTQIGSEGAIVPVFTSTSGQIQVGAGSNRFTDASLSPYSVGSVIFQKLEYGVGTPGTQFVTLSMPAAIAARQSALLFVTGLEHTCSPSNAPSILAVGIYDVSANLTGYGKTLSLYPSLDATAITPLWAAGAITQPYETGVSQVQFFFDNTADLNGATGFAHSLTFVLNKGWDYDVNTVAIGIAGAAPVKGVLGCQPATNITYRWVGL